MSTKAVSILKSARALLTRGWTTGFAARDAGGGEVNVESPEACQWCSIGAIRRVEKDINMDDFDDDVRIALYAAARKRGFCGIVDFNDAQKSVEPVLAVFDEAIASLESEG